MSSKLLTVGNHSSNFVRPPLFWWQFWFYFLSWTSSNQKGFGIMKHHYLLRTLLN